LLQVHLSLEAVEMVAWAEAGLGLGWGGMQEQQTLQIHGKTRLDRQHHREA